MKEVQRKTIVTGASLLPKHIEQLEQLEEEKGYLNRSETIRRCIEFTHEKTFPDYIYKRSASDIAKRQKIATEGQIRALEPIQLAEQEIGNGLHVTMKGGEDYYFMHTFGNSVWTQPLATLHDDKDEISDIIALHKRTVEEGRFKLTDRLSKWWVQTLKINNGLEIETIHGEPELTEKVKGYYSDAQEENSD